MMLSYLTVFKINRYQTRRIILQNVDRCSDNAFVQIWVHEPVSLSLKRLPSCPSYGILGNIHKVRKPYFEDFWPSPLNAFYWRHPFTNASFAQILTRKHSISFMWKSDWDTYICIRSALSRSVGSSVSFRTLSVPSLSSTKVSFKCLPKRVFPFDSLIVWMALKAYHKNEILIKYNFLLIVIVFTEKNFYSDSQVQSVWADKCRSGPK